MSVFFPSSALDYIFIRIFEDDLKLKLFANDHTPAIGDTLASLTEVSGGGYAEIELEFANWTITQAELTVALYNALQDFNFTGATSGPGTVYGYFVTNMAGDQLIWEQRFDEVPITPQNGALIRIRPKVTNRNIV